MKLPESRQAPGDLQAGLHQGIECVGNGPEAAAVDAHGRAGGTAAAPDASCRKWRLWMLIPYCLSGEDPGGFRSIYRASARAIERYTNSPRLRKRAAHGSPSLSRKSRQDESEGYCKNAQQCQRAQSEIPARQTGRIDRGGERAHGAGIPLMSPSRGGQVFQDSSGCKANPPRARCSTPRYRARHLKA
jgi:hypothetical protein